MGRKKKLRFDGEEADVSWDGRLCIHMEECWRDRSELFQLGRKPFGQPDTVDKEYVLSVAKRCPSGAIVYHEHPGEAAERTENENTVRVAPDGPLYFRGQLNIEGADEDMEAVQFRAALCRCGKSNNKPFCDTSHAETDFTDTGTVGQVGPGLGALGGPLKVTCAPNGPLIVSGNFSIRSGSGHCTWTGQKAALCRCGHSSNKPFCDGTHKSIDFKTQE